MRFLVFCLFYLLIFSCKEEKKDIEIGYETTTGFAQDIKYAKGFRITSYENYKEIIVTSPWPDSKEVYRYILTDDKSTLIDQDKNTVIIQTPVKRIVAMSTTNIPALEYLGIDSLLVGFPNTDYISSEKTRANVDNGNIRDLNNNLELNMETLLELAPDLVIGFSVNGNDKNLNQIKKFSIPVVLDGAWTEQHPLGCAEWIKFIAAFFNKEDEADAVFKTIEKDYLAAKQLASHVKEIPVVISGSAFKDVWNVPGGDSFVAKYLEDANTNYIWKENDDTGSLQLNFENVLNKAKNADFWIGAGSFNTKSEMASSNKGYTYFDAYKNNSIYTYTNKVGATGGILYYELGPLRPDLILKDIISITHPNILANYEPFFFKVLK